MYNEDIKLRFLDEYTKNASYKSTAAALLNSLEKYEILFARDFCTMAKEQIQVVLDNVIGMRTRTQLSQMVILRKYIKWCIDAGVDGARDDLLELKPAGVEKMRIHMVSSPSHLQACLDLVFAPESDRTIDNMYRAYSWFAYAGIEDYDAFRLTAENFDLESMVIRLDGVEYPVYQEGVQAIRNMLMLTEFIVFRGGMVYPLERFPSNKVMRGIKTEGDYIKIRSELSRRFTTAARRDERVHRLSYDRMQTSGLFYETYEQEKLHHTPSFKHIADRYERRTANSEISQEFIDKRKRAIENDYMNDYLKWKLAFYN